MMDEIINKINEEDMEEDAPTNNVGGGNIAGVGVGPDGEPGIRMSKAKKKKKENEDEQDKITRKIKTMMMKKEEVNNVALSSVLDTLEFVESGNDQYQTFKDKYNG